MTLPLPTPPELILLALGAALIVLPLLAKVKP